MTEVGSIEFRASLNTKDIPAQVAARAMGCSGVSEMLEKLGRGELLLPPVEADER